MTSRGYKSQRIDIVTYQERTQIESTNYQSHIDTVDLKSKQMVTDYRVRVYRDMISKAKCSDLGARYHRCIWTNTTRIKTDPTEWQSMMDKVLDHLSKVNII
jgi:hypothetical protein